MFEPKIKTGTEEVIFSNLPAGEYEWQLNQKNSSNTSVGYIKILSKNLETKLSLDKTKIEVFNIPSNSANIKIAYCKNMNDKEPFYTTSSVFTTGIPGIIKYPVIGVIAVDSNGKDIGEWAPRRETFPAIPIPVPTPAPVPKPSGFSPGLVLNSDTESPATLKAVSLGAKVARAEFSIDEGTAVALKLKNTLNNKCILQPLIGFQGRIPTSSEAKGITKFLSISKRLEFGNETNYQISSNFGNGEDYGFRVKEAVEAIEPLGGELLVQGSDAGTKSPAWLEGIFKAFPNIIEHKIAWTIHPYFGGNTAKSQDTWGIPMMERMVGTLARLGDTFLPIEITEVGPPSSPSGTVFTTGQRMDYQEAAEVLKQHIPKLREAGKGRVRGCFLFQAHDQAPIGSTDREKYFGALKSDGSEKQYYTQAVKEFLNS